MTDEDNAKKMLVVASEHLGTSLYGKKWEDLTEQQRKNLTYFAKKVRETLEKR